MIIVTFYRDSTDESANQGRTFILPAGEDLDRLAEDSGFNSYKVIREKVEYLELVRVEQISGNLFGVCWAEQS